MATTEANGTDVTHGEILWRSADKLRGQIDAAEYKHVALGLLPPDLQEKATQTVLEKAEVLSGEWAF